MGIFTPLPLAEAVRLGADLGIEVSAVEPLSAGSVNSNFRLRTPGGEEFFARIYEEQGVDGAGAELRLLGELARAGVPVVVPRSRPGRAGPLTTQGKPFAVYPWVSGDIVCSARVTLEHCEQVGQALGRVHGATPSLSRIPEGRFNVDDVARRLSRIEAAGEEYRSDARYIRERLDFHAARRDPELPSGLVHGDLFRDNVLWSEDRIAALIDFESASRGPFVFDLLVTLQAWCFTDVFVTERVRSLLSGYHSIRPLTGRELSAFVTEGALAALRFATTRITDFAMRAPPGKEPKRDYRRFLQRLSALEQGALDKLLLELDPAAP